MADQYPYLSGVRSNIQDQQIRQERVPLSPEAILIFGTATKGPLFTPTQIDSTTAVQTFGENVSDPYERFNLMKGFYEISTAFPGTRILGVRIGNAKKAKLNMYEHQYASGLIQPESEDTISMTLEATSDGLGGNNVSTTVYGDDDGMPTQMLLNLATGTTLTYDLNELYKPSLLAGAINNNEEAREEIEASVNYLTKDVSVTITENASASGFITTEYETGESFLTAISSALKDSNVNEQIPSGRSTYDLEYMPAKDEDENTKTIDKFFAVVSQDILGESEAPAGTQTFDLSIKSNNRWLAGETDAVTNLVVYVKETSGFIVEQEEDIDYTYSNGTIDFGSPLSVGVTVIADYKARVEFLEANVRSELDLGDPSSYFVGGNTIVFGTSQPWIVEVEYVTNREYDVPGEVYISDADAGKIKFSLGDNAPSIGDTVTLTLLYEPELPAPNGTTLPSGKIVSTSLTGGTDGRAVNLENYYNQLTKGYISADNIPCRMVVPQGIYLDSVMNGIDFETGLPTQMNAGFQDQLLAFIKRHSTYVSECTGYLSAKPMETSNPTSPSLEERERWYDRLVNIQPTDGTAAANVITGIADFHLRCTAGDLILSHPKVNGGKPYVEGAANIASAMFYHHDNLSSIITRDIPRSVVRGISYEVVAADKVNKINSMRYMLATRDTDNGALKFADDPTLGLSTSQFRKAYNFDITVEAVSAVRQIAKKFLGRPNTPQNREALKQRGNQILQNMSREENRKLIYGSIDVVTTRGEAISGRTNIRLRLVEPVTMQVIEITTQIELGF